MVSRYNEFVESFSGLSPFQLSHLSDVLLAKIESRCEGRLQVENTKFYLDEGDLKVAFIDMMKEIVLEINKIQIAQQQSEFSHKLYGMFASHMKVA